MSKPEDKFRRTIEWEFYEDDLFFVSQMFEDEWSPRDTPVRTRHVKCILAFCSHAVSRSFLKSPK